MECKNKREKEMEVTPGKTYHCYLDGNILRYTGKAIFIIKSFSESHISSNHC